MISISMEKIYTRRAYFFEELINFCWIRLWIYYRENTSKQKFRIRV